ncbi:MAG: caspase family protein [Cyclobacteriaceae bacterium]
MWNRVLPLIFIGLMSSQLLFGQRNYTDITADQRTELFYDGFDDNHNHWFTGTDRRGRREGRIENGHYVWKSKSDFYDEHASWIEVPINQTKDFEIEARIAFVQGNPREESTSLSWGRSEKGSYFFGFKKGTYFISQWRKVGGLEQYVKPRKTTYLHANGYNKLTVRKNGASCFFYINEVLVHTMPFQEFFGQRIGFESNNLIKVDFLRVSYIEEGGETPLAQQSTGNPPKENPDEITFDAREDVSGTEVRDSDVAPATTVAEKENSSEGDHTFDNQAIAENSRPVITITEPSLTRGFKQIAVQNIRIVGQAEDQDGIQEVRINDQPAWLRSDGSFSLEAPLHLGDNQFTVTATDRQQQSASTTFSIRREAPALEKRLALVIGNSAYEQGGQLRNPMNDAAAMQEMLEGLGFTVMKYENCRQNDIKRAIDEFGEKLKDFDIGLFFYAGHGLQVEGANYLVPVDAKLSSAYDVEYDCVRADRVLAKMEAANSRTNIVLLDACRDNPFERSWSRSTRGNGLAFMNAPRGSLVAYATAPGQTASDGGGEHGVYTEALLKHLPTPDITIEQVFKRVRTTVSQKSEGKQIPWESTSLTGDFYFKR